MRGKNHKISNQWGGGEVCRQWGLSGRPIRYEDVAPESCLRSLLASGMPQEYARLVLDMFAEIRGGATTQVTHAVEEITGRRPRDLAAYARDYRDQLI